jgi:hypothetical protein
MAVSHLDSEQYALLEQALLAEGARLELKDVGASSIITI